MSSTMISVLQSVDFKSDASQDERFPLVLQSSTAGSGLNVLLSAIQKSREALEHELREGSGAIRFTGFQVRNAEEFAQVVEAFGYPSIGYQKGAARRTRLAGPVFTSNALDPETELGFHNEMSYLKDYPDIVMFFCEIAPTVGGATGIVQGKVIHEALSEKFPEFVSDLENKGITYYNLRTQEEWQTVYATSDRAEAELKASGMAKQLVWLEDGCVKEVFHGPNKGVKTLENGEKVWFNSVGSAHPMFKNFQYFEFGDGSKIPGEVVEAAKKLMSEKQVPIQWKEGEVVVVNNHQVLHAKHASCPPRKILVAMLKASNLNQD